LFFDNVRSLAVLLVVLFHAGISYSNVVPWWYVVDSNRSLLFDVFTAILAVFMMPVLFFVAGYFALPSLQDKGPADFLKSKFKRLGIPWLFGVFFLVPIMPYVRHYTRSASNGETALSYWRFWVTSMRSSGWFRYAPINLLEDRFYPGYFWFVSLLLCFFVVLCLLYEARKKWLGGSAHLGQAEATSSRSILVRLLVFGCISSAGFLAVGWLSSFESWVIIANVLLFQPASLVLYICYFSLGVYAFSRRWFANGHELGRLTTWGPACFLLSIGYLIVVQKALAGPTRKLAIAFAFSHSFLCLAFVVVLTSLALRYWNRPSTIGQRLASNSYNIYLVHLPIVVTFQLLLAAWRGPVLVKFAIVAVGSVLSSYGISKYVIRKSRLLTVIGLVVLFALMSILIRPR
ncbi:MAG: acyltransferase family protein, partial [Phycisphaerales bacterium]